MFHLSKLRRYADETWWFLTRLSVLIYLVAASETCFSSRFHDSWPCISIFLKEYEGFRRKNEKTMIPRKLHVEMIWKFGGTLVGVRNCNCWKFRFFWLLEKKIQFNFFFELQTLNTIFSLENTKKHIFFDFCERYFTFRFWNIARTKSGDF